MTWQLRSIFAPTANILYYYISDSLWKIWLVESIQSIHNSLWTWHDINKLSAADITIIMSSSKCAWLLRSVLLRNKMAGCFASVSEDELCEKCIIKQLLKSIFTWYHELSNPRVCVICLSLRLRQITQTSVLIIHDIMLNHFQ